MIRRHTWQKAAIATGAAGLIVVGGYLTALGVLLYQFANTSYRLDANDPQMTWLWLFVSVAGIALIVAAVVLAIRLWRATTTTHHPRQDQP